VSLRYNFPLSDRFTLEMLADVFNVFDTVNYNGLGGTRAGLGSFLTPQSAFNPRELQLGAKLRF
jgi:hypothetical protein